MPRPRHPSDDARLKRPKGVLISFEVLSPDPDKPGQAEVFASLELRGMWAWLLVHAGRSFAGRTGDRATLHDGALAEITGRRHRQSAVNALRKLCDLMDYSIEDRGHSVVVHVKNLSQNQGWTPRSSADLREHSWSPPARASDSESDSELDSDTDKEEEQKSASRSAAAAPDGSDSAEGTALDPPEPGPIDPAATNGSPEVSPAPQPPPPAQEKPPRRRKGRVRAQAPLLPTPVALPTEPHALRELLLSKLDVYPPGSSYFGPRRERELWLDANLPRMQAWVESDPERRTLLIALQSFWQTYCDEPDRQGRRRRWRDEAQAEHARRKATELEAEIAREALARANSPPPDELPEGFVIESLA